VRSSGFDCWSDPSIPTGGGTSWASLQTIFDYVRDAQSASGGKKASASRDRFAGSLVFAGALVFAAALRVGELNAQGVELAL
jgi:hypothetical protein